MRLRAAFAASAVLAAAASMCAVSVSAVPAQAATTHPTRLGAPAARTVHAAVVKASTGPLADPTSNTAPSQTFVAACHNISTSKSDNDACDAAALGDFNAVRATEGLPAMTLPSGFDTLSVPLQLLAITNVERVDRGLAPVPGLTSGLNSLAQTAASNDQDPDWPSPFPGDVGTSNWAAAGNSALLDDFYWMYDDGYGSFNVDCSSPTDSGCWGHRHDILYPFDDPIRMGAAVAYNTPYGTSMTEEFIGGDGTDQVDVAPTWADIAGTAASGTATFSLDTERLIIITDTGQSSSGTVVASGTGGSESLTAAVRGSGWSVAPGNCLVSASHSCSFVVHFNPANSGTSYGTLQVAGSAGTKQVSLTGWQAPPRLTAATSTHQVRRHHHARITGVIANYKRIGMADRRVTLQRRQVGSGRWRNLTTRRSHTHGVVRFVVRPHRAASYRLVAIARNGRLESSSRSMKIRVRRR